MDGINLPEIVGLLIFFLISILTSYFDKKKKKKQKAERERNAPPPDLESNNTQSLPEKEKAEKSVFDIFQEAFEDKDEEYIPTSVPNYNQSFEVGTPLSDIAKPEFIETESLVGLEIKKKLEKVATSHKEINKRAIAFKKKLRDKKTVRDLFILKEILEKPKALRN